jgi:enamine deaminase RidA (YjgF/YER057c/UK114 family)
VVSGETSGASGTRPHSGQPATSPESTGAALPPERDQPAAAGPLEIIQPEGWQAPKGYANAVAGRGRLVFVAGQVGWDPVTGSFAGDDLAAQAAQALANVAAVLRAAGAEPRHVVRLTWYVTDRDEYRAARSTIGAAYRAVMGRHYPAMSLLVVQSLLEERAKVEIEATALLPEPGEGPPGSCRPPRRGRPAIEPP